MRIFFPAASANCTFTKTASTAKIIVTLRNRFILKNPPIISVVKNRKEQKYRRSFPRMLPYHPLKIPDLTSMPSHPNEDSTRFLVGISNRHPHSAQNQFRME